MKCVSRSAETPVVSEVLYSCTSTGFFKFYGTMLIYYSQLFRMGFAPLGSALHYSQKAILILFPLHLALPPFCVNIGFTTISFHLVFSSLVASFLISLTSLFQAWWNRGTLFRNPVLPPCYCSSLVIALFSE